MLAARAVRENDSSGISPTGSAAVLDALAGTWTLGSSSDALPGGCTTLEYNVTQGSDGNSGTVAFNGVCAGAEASGSGTGDSLGVDVELDR